MDTTHLLLSSHLPAATNVTHQLLSHLLPYTIVLANFFLFRFLRLIVKRIFLRYVSPSSSQPSSSLGGTKVKLLRLFLNELISTSELCASCAELNVVYEKHGSTAYGMSLFLLSYLWIDSFGDSYTTPGYIVEDYFLVRGNELLKSGDAYVRFIGQSLAMPLAWRFASIYWKYQLISEHKELSRVSDELNCKTSLTTSTINGFLIELTCCLLCRLIELIGQKLLERDALSQRVVSLFCSFSCSMLVVLALELSGGYFNPVLAASLEYGCKGIEFYQHAIVFWFGPLIGHLIARVLFRRYGEQLLLAPPDDGALASKRRKTTATSSSIQAQQQVKQTRKKSLSSTQQQQERRLNGNDDLNGDVKQQSKQQQQPNQTEEPSERKRTRASQRRRKMEKID